MAKAQGKAVTAATVERRILVIRDRQVMLDEDLADLYGVETRILVQQVKRNVKRFPADFMFQLTKAEAEVLRSQIVISNTGRGGRRYAPYVFTEQGVAMLSSVLRSDRAIAGVATSYTALQARLDDLERDMTARLDEHDEQLSQIFEALHQLISPPASPKRPVGFRIREGGE